MATALLLAGLAYAYSMCKPHERFARLRMLRLRLVCMVRAISLPLTLTLNFALTPTLTLSLAPTLILPLPLSLPLPLPLALTPNPNQVRAISLRAKLKQFVAFYQVPSPYTSLDLPASPYVSYGSTRWRRTSQRCTPSSCRQTRRHPTLNP